MVCDIVGKSATPAENGFWSSILAFQENMWMKFKLLASRVSQG